MSSIIEAVSTLTIGSVEFVAPDEIKVLLDVDAPHATALNTGQPSRFPRINGFVLIPNEAGSLVGLVTWLGVERAAYPKRTGMRDFGLVDLPFPQRKMSLNPVGTLRTRVTNRGTSFELERGSSCFRLSATQFLYRQRSNSGQSLNRRGLMRAFESEVRRSRPTHRWLLIQTSSLGDILRSLATQAAGSRAPLRG
jgi:hypothetical protein